MIIWENKSVYGDLTMANCGSDENLNKTLNQI